MKFTIAATIIAYAASANPGNHIGDSCKVNGVKGVCDNTSSCFWNGGKSTAGLCKGPADVQCCVVPVTPTEIPTCYLDNGYFGYCAPTAACKWLGDSKPHPGFCAGPADIQCCVSEGEARI